jgi:hypothetical protein
VLINGCNWQEGWERKEIKTVETNILSKVAKNHYITRKNCQIFKI